MDRKHMTYHVSLLLLPVNQEEAAESNWECLYVAILHTYLSFPFYLPFKNVLTFERTVKGYIFLSSADNSSNLLWLPCTLPEYRMLFQLCTEVGTVVKGPCKAFSGARAFSAFSSFKYTLKRHFYFLLHLFKCVCVTHACMHTHTHTMPGCMSGS